MAVARARRKPEDLAGTLAAQLTLAKIGGWVREYRFLPPRLWRIDIAFPVEQIAVECEGVGARGKAGRHQLTQHMHDNCEKHSALAAAGWRLIRVTGVQLHLGYALRWIEAALAHPADPTPIFAEVTHWDLNKVRDARVARARAFYARRTTGAPPP